MVRVISVHHFASQHIQTVEQPTACTVAPPNRLLLALTSNCVEVRDLGNESDVLFTFPTVDEVVQIVHCLNGDYVATMETKFNRQNKETNFVRVYINWDSIATLQQSKMTSSGVSLGSSECGMVQPMRARIAGRVTPTTNQSELGSLEMIEIPVKRNPNYIECCQVSGNLVILSNRIINVYKFQVKSHDISKLRFVDFEELPLLIEVPFAPMQIAICENYIACISEDCMHLFKILLNSNSGPIDYKKLLSEEMLNATKEKITVNLPSIVKENSLIHKNSPFTFSDKDMLATNKSPVYVIQNLIQLKLVPIMIESAQRQVTEQFKSLILKPLYIDQNLNKSSPDSDRFLRSDYSKCLNSMVCIIATQQEGYLYYFDDADPGTDRDNCIAVYPFTAPVFKLVMEDYFLHALTETGLESYTLRFAHQLCRNFEAVDNINVACPLITDSICLVGAPPLPGNRADTPSRELPGPPSEFRDIPHSFSQLQQQVGFYTGYFSIITFQNIFVCSSNASFLTLYNLELPSPKTIFNDISIMANVHRFTSAQTYYHLMSEAHMVLRIALLLKKWTMTDDNVKLIIQAKGNNEDLIETYRTSCALLGTIWLCALCRCYNEEEYSLSVPYYKMARVMPFEVLKRVKKIQEQSNNQNTRGLMYYLKRTLLEIKSGLDADKFFGSSSKQNFSESILELLESHGFEDLPSLILKSKVVREYSTDKLIYILSKKIPEDVPRPSEKYLALAILYVQKCKMDRAQEHLETITKDDLRGLLLENHELLFETTYSLQNKSKGVTTFSELAVLLIGICPELLSAIFVTLIMDKRVVNLNKIIKVFLEYLPSSIGTDSNSASIVLQKTLQQYFERYFSKPENVDLTKIIYEKGACEAMKLLVRSYLSQLQILQLKEHNDKKEAGSNKDTARECLEVDEDDIDKDRDQEKLAYNRINNTYFREQADAPKKSYLFSHLRYEYLDKMPPFQLEITSKLYQACVENYPAKEEYQPNEEADQVLRKLQALLCSQVVPKQVIAEVNGYLSVNESLRGNESLQSITMGTNDAVLLLIDACPQCLLQFGKDRFSRTNEWKFLIATIQRRILRLSQNETLKRVCFFHKKILKDMLTYVASSMTLDQLVQVFPKRFSTSDEEVADKENCSDNVGLDKGEYAKNEADYTDGDLDILGRSRTTSPTWSSARRRCTRIK
ncbi:hypothetical protein NQ318_005707 [Aromia moschata]|uniref:Hermansky-Pudlak syndrome 3 protein n=1 Tax=Aromia moschata TaxID=1265417 RepID=A0AAV8XKE4_9CUCU|nr:hypothetical protein NQ318_005707 [Aromia moschata]